MKNASNDQNWSWPEETWFQKRLNAIKSREQELRRKPTVVSNSSMALSAKSESDQEMDPVGSEPKP